MRSVRLRSVRLDSVRSLHVLLSSLFVLCLLLAAMTACEGRGFSLGGEGGQEVTAGAASDGAEGAADRADAGPPAPDPSSRGGADATGAPGAAGQAEVRGDGSDGDPTVGAPGAACHPRIAAAIETCVDDWLTDPDVATGPTARLDLLEQCADAEPVAPARDAICAEDDPPPALCEGTFEAFATAHLPVCRQELTDRLLDETCVFGERHADLVRGSDAVVVVSRRALPAGSPLDVLHQAQLARAIHAAAGGAELAAANLPSATPHTGEVGHFELWDASGRRPFTAWVVGADPEASGMVFRYGTTTPVAMLRDGALVECLATWGPERRRCRADADCAPELRCVGEAPDAGFGRCVAVDAHEHAGRGQACRVSAECPRGAGLVCAGAGATRYGSCQPAWMQGRFAADPAIPVPDGSLVGAETPLLVYGLAEEVTDVALDLVVEHPRTGDLLVTLTLPSGREVRVFDGAWDGAELALEGWRVPALSPGEPANGLWWLRVSDLRPGAAGALVHVGLTVTSRQAGE